MRVKGKKVLVLGMGVSGVAAAHLVRGEIIVTEISTFQLETIDKFSPHISCILNITPDHLDRHLSLENYSDLKARIFRNQKNKDFTVLNRDDARVYPLASKTKAQ
ncbi:unnamed protein product, partial [marine sediment metagenome]